MPAESCRQPAPQPTFWPHTSAQARPHTHPGSLGTASPDPCFRSPPNFMPAFPNACAPVAPTSHPLVTFMERFSVMEWLLVNFGGGATCCQAAPRPDCLSLDRVRVEFRAGFAWRFCARSNSPQPGRAGQPLSYGQACRQASNPHGHATGWLGTHGARTYPVSAPVRHLPTISTVCQCSSPSRLLQSRHCTSSQCPSHCASEQRIK